MQDWKVEEIVPGTTPPATDIVKLTNALLALKSNFFGASLPTTNLYPGMDVVLTNGTRWVLNAAGTSWIAAGNVNLANLGFALTSGATFTGGINEAPSTVESSATPDIFTLTVGNVINYTGTATCTGFAEAPQAGARRTLICAAAAVFTAGANMLIDGVTSGQNLACAAGVQVDVVAITTTQFRLKFTPVQGSFASTVTSATGSLTSASGTVYYTRDGNICHFNADLTITTNGTGATETNFTLPFTHKATSVSSFVGRETQVSGKRLWGYITSSSALATVVNLADGTYVGGDGYVLRVSGSYPIA